MKISPEWQLVLDNYFKIKEEWQRELFLKNMSPSQRSYLIGLANSQMANFQPAAEVHTNSNFNQPASNYAHPSVYATHGGDAHLLNHKSYVNSKRKWWATLLPVFIIGTAVSGIAGMVFFAWLGGGLPKLALFNGISGNKAKADELSYTQWIDNFKDLSDKSETGDSDKDGLTNLEEFKLGLNPAQTDENNNKTVEGLDFINKDSTLIKNFTDNTNVWAVVESQEVFLRLQRNSLNKLGQNTSGSSLLKLNKVIIPKLNNLEVAALPENTSTSDKSEALKDQAAIVHYEGTNWAGENLSVWFSNQSQFEEMLPQDRMEAYLEDSFGNSWYQLYKLRSANIFSADSVEIFKSDSSTPNLKIVLCQPKASCNKALVLTFEIQETKQFTFDNQANSAKV
jgi:hypothetical protein